jgi:hypothetical protein
VRAPEEEKTEVKKQNSGAQNMESNEVISAD